MFGGASDMKINVSRRIDEGHWNARLTENPMGTIYQTTYYAEFTRKIHNRVPVYVEAVSDEGQAQLLLLISPPFKSIFRWRKLPDKLRELLTTFKSRIGWNYGPVVSGDDGLYSSILNAALDVKRSKIDAIIMDATPHPLDDRKTCFSTLGFSAKTVGTFIINLKQDPKGLWANLDKKSVRKNVERAIERGVQVEVTDSHDGLLEYYAALAEARKRSGLLVPPFESVSELWRCLGKDHYLKCFLARWNGKVVAALLISTFNGYMNEWGAATSPITIENKLYAAELVKWEVIKWGNENNMRFYDLTGVELNAVDEKSKGIFRFKEKWGGELTEYNKYDI